MGTSFLTIKAEYIYIRNYSIITLSWNRKNIDIYIYIYMYVHMSLLTCLHVCTSIHICIYIYNACVYIIIIFLSPE